MTAAVISADETGIVVYSDGVECNPFDGYRLIGLRSKVVQLAHIPALLVGFGRTGFTEWMSMARSPLWIDFDSMLRRFAEDAHATRAYFRNELFPGRPCNALVVAAGWSAERSSFEIYECWVTDEGKDELPTVKLWGNGHMRPELSDEALAAAGFLPDGKISLLPERIVDFMNLQRAMPSKSISAPDDEPGYIVGGFIQETILTMANGIPYIGTRIIHRWPDVIGEPIRP